jgi:hypothetical protein
MSEKENSLNGLLVHIGYHKTATTWMQRRLLIPEHGFRQLLSHEEVELWLTGPHALEFDCCVAARTIEQKYAAVGDNFPCISSELLTGLPYSGARESTEFARRVQSTMPTARILFTIREQKRLLVSLYSQYIRRGGRLSPRHFFLPESELGYARFNYRSLEFDRLVGYYQSLFGTEQVFVLTQELLVRQPTVFVDRLREFCGIDPVDSYPDSSRMEGASDAEFVTILTRRLNHFRRDSAGGEPLLNLGSVAKLGFRILGKFSRSSAAAPFRKYKPVSRVVEAEFSGKFTESNHRLRTICPGLELDIYD